MDTCPMPSNPNNTTQSLRIKVLRSAVPPSHPHSRSRRPTAASHSSLAVTAARPPAHASSCSFPAAHHSLASPPPGHPPVPPPAPSPSLVAPLPSPPPAHPSVPPTAPAAARPVQTEARTSVKALFRVVVRCWSLPLAGRHSRRSTPLDGPRGC